MSIRAKWIALMVAVVVMLVGMQLYYGNLGGTTGQSASPETTFDWWIYSGTSTEYYSNYSENPAIQYTLRRGWGPDEKGIALLPAEAFEEELKKAMEMAQRDANKNE